MEEKSSRVQIIVSVLALVGVLGTALFSNWDKLFSSSGANKAAKPSQSTTGTASPNIGSVQGDVNISVNQAQPSLNVPEISGTFTAADKIYLLEKFVEDHRGKLVHINVDISGEQSQITEAQGEFLSLASAPCETGIFDECATTHLVLTGQDYELGWYQGSNRLAGYFVIDETVEMHGGRYYGLKGVRREEVLLRTQRKN